MFGRLLCRVFGHKHIMKFHPKGVFWCHSAGWFDDVCERCDWSADKTPEGQKRLETQRLDKFHPHYGKDVVSPRRMDLLKSLLYCAIDLGEIRTQLERTELEAMETAGLVRQNNVQGWTYYVITEAGKNAIPK